MSVPSRAYVSAGHEERRKMMSILSKTPMDQVDLLMYFPGMSQPTMSRHLTHLADSGLVTVTRVTRGPGKIYSVNSRAVRALAKEIIAMDPAGMDEFRAKKEQTNGN
jgi:DNA-binding transcriptional ArsR family regulator